jgi:hypothetical protein
MLAAKSFILFCMFGPSLAPAFSNRKNEDAVAAISHSRAVFKQKILLADRVNSVPNRVIWALLARA